MENEISEIDVWKTGRNIFHHWPIDQCWKLILSGFDFVCSAGWVSVWLCVNPRARECARTRCSHHNNELRKNNDNNNQLSTINNHQSRYKNRQSRTTTPATPTHAIDVRGGPPTTCYHYFNRKQPQQQTATTTTTRGAIRRRRRRRTTTRGARTRTTTTSGAITRTTEIQQSTITHDMGPPLRAQATVPRKPSG